MAIVKANFTKSAKAAKATIRYIQGRPGRDGEALERTLFGSDGPMERDTALQMITEAGKGTVFFRIILSPDPTREDATRDLDLWEITTQMLLTLEERVGHEVRFVAAEHNDHTPNRHVHVVALHSGRLTKEDFQALRTSATQACRFQRRERDLAASSQGLRQGASSVREAPAPGFLTLAQPRQDRYVSSVRPMRNIPRCPRCLSHYVLYHCTKTLLQCPGCGVTYGVSQSALTSQEAGWEL